MSRIDNVRHQAWQWTDGTSGDASDPVADIQPRLNAPQLRPSVQMTLRDLARYPWQPAAAGKARTGMRALAQVAAALGLR